MRVRPPGLKTGRRRGPRLPPLPPPPSPPPPPLRARGHPEVGAAVVVNAEGEAQSLRGLRHGHPARAPPPSSQNATSAPALSMTSTRVPRIGPASVEPGGVAAVLRRLRSTVRGERQRPARAAAAGPSRVRPSPGSRFLSSLTGPERRARELGARRRELVPQVGDRLGARSSRDGGHVLIRRVNPVLVKPDGHEHQRRAPGCRPGRPRGRCRPPW